MAVALLNKQIVAGILFVLLLLLLCGSRSSMSCGSGFARLSKVKGILIVLLLLLCGSRSSISSVSAKLVSNPRYTHCNIIIFVGF